MNDPWRRYDEWRTRTSEDEEDERERRRLKRERDEDAADEAYDRWRDEQ